MFRLKRSEDIEVEPVIFTSKKFICEEKCDIFVCRERLKQFLGGCIKRTLVMYSTDIGSEMSVFAYCPKK